MLIKINEKLLYEIYESLASGMTYGECTVYSQQHGYGLVTFGEYIFMRSLSKYANNKSLSIQACAAASNLHDEPVYSSVSVASSRQGCCGGGKVV